MCTLPPDRAVVLFAICVAGFFVFFYIFLKWNAWHERRSARLAVDHMISDETRWAERPPLPEKPEQDLRGIVNHQAASRPRTPSPLAESPQMSQTQAQEYRQQYGQHLYPPGSGPSSPASPSARSSGRFQAQTYAAVPVHSGRSLSQTYSAVPVHSPPSPRRKPPPRSLADEGSRASSPLSSPAMGPGRW